MDNTVLTGKQKSIPDRKKRKKIIIISCIIGFFVLFFVGLFLFGNIHVSYDDLYGGIKPVERNGIIEFDAYFSDFGLTCININLSKTIIFDYDKGVQYDYRYIWFSGNRWGIWFDKDICELQSARLYPDGKDTGMQRVEFDPNIDYRENPMEMDFRFIRVYYLNPDGSYVLIWEHPEAKEITERLGVTLPEPDSDEVNWIRNRRR